MVGGCLKPSRFSQSIVSVIHILQRFAFVRRGRSWVPSPLAGEGQGEGKSSGNESTHPNEKCCNLHFNGKGGVVYGTGIRQGQDPSGQEGGRQHWVRL